MESTVIGKAAWHPSFLPPPTMWSPPPHTHTQRNECRESGSYFLAAAPPVSGFCVSGGSETGKAEGKNKPRPSPVSGAQAFPPRGPNCLSLLHHFPEGFLLLCLAYCSWVQGTPQVDPTGSKTTPPGSQPGSPAAGLATPATVALQKN